MAEHRRGTMSTIRRTNWGREFIIDSKKCHYCDILLDKEKRDGGKMPDNAMTVDHIIPRSSLICVGKEHTTKENCLPCCYLCNKLKGRMPYKMFNEIANNFIKKNRNSLTLQMGREYIKEILSPEERKRFY